MIIGTCDVRRTPLESVVVDVRVECRQRGGRRAQHVHRMCVLHRANHVVDRRGKGARGLERRVEL
jgi:hypothetical protein